MTGGVDPCTLEHAMTRVDPAAAGHDLRAAAAAGHRGSVATPLFGAYVIPFEIASVLLLAAIVGAVVLAKRKL